MTEDSSHSDDREILLYYEEQDEATRLTKGAGLLEFARMKEIIR